MSVWNYVFDNDFNQRFDIDHLKEGIKELTSGLGSMHSQAKSLADRVHALEQEMEETTLLLRALLSALRESGTVDPKLLGAVLQRVDFGPGGEAGAKKKTPSPPITYSCTGCQRTFRRTLDDAAAMLVQGKTKCQYCGGEFDFPPEAKARAEELKKGG